jgi:hypothetical protein
MDTTHWNDDELNRKEDAAHLRRVLIARYQQRAAAGGSASYILNLDATWGQGKTFFLTRFAKDLENDFHPVAYVNAWQDDLSDQPIVSIMSAIDQALKPHLSGGTKASRSLKRAKGKLGVVALEVAKQVAVHGLKVTTGISAEKVAGMLTDDADIAKTIGEGTADAVFDAATASFEKSIASHRASLQAIREFKAELAAAIASITQDSDTQFGAPLVVLIDELDRCRPLYAIRLLEDAKHLFQVNGVVFVIATDSSQLSHSIKAIYGSEFGARDYLRRFFDRTYVFPHASRGQFIETLLRARGIDMDVFVSLGASTPLHLFQQWARGLDITLRDLEQMVDVMETFITSWNHSCKINLFLLLINLWSFFQQSRGTWVAFTDFNFAELDDPMFSKWIVHYEEIKFSTSGQPERVTRAAPAGKLFERLCIAVRANIDDLRPDQSVWAAYLLAGSGWGDIAFEQRTTILREYASRVWNAGRLVDRPPAY